MGLKYPRFHSATYTAEMHLQVYKLGRAAAHICVLYIWRAEEYENVRMQSAQENRYRVMQVIRKRCNFVLSSRYSIYLYTFTVSITYINLHPNFLYIYSKICALTNSTSLHVQFVCTARYRSFEQTGTMRITFIVHIGLSVTYTMCKALQLYSCESIEN